MDTASVMTQLLPSCRSARRLRISAAEARTRVEEAALGGPSEPLDVGRTRRSVPLGIRRTLIRDSGCAFPGCDRPPWMRLFRPTDSGSTSHLGYQKIGEFFCGVGVELVVAVTGDQR